MLVSLTIPLYNEEACFGEGLNPLIAALESRRIDYELALVDNGSHDKTGKLIDRLAAKNPRIKKVVVAVNQGYGWGIIQGLKAARGDYIGHMWGDGQISPEDILKAVDKALTGEYDLVKAQRVKRKSALARRVVSKIYDLTFPVFFGLKSRDLNGAPKLFRRNLLETLDLKSKDWFIDAEIVIKCEYMNLKIAEIPVTYEVRKGGKSHVSLLRDIWQFIKNGYNFKTGTEYAQWKKSRQ